MSTSILPDSLGPCQTFKPIFHLKRRLHCPSSIPCGPRLGPSWAKLGPKWAPDGPDWGPFRNAAWVATHANEMDTNNMKCTCPMQDFCVGDPTQPIFHWLALGFCVRANAKFKFCVGCGANLRVCIGSKIPTCWYPQRKILASGALPNANPRRQVFCVAVEYRLYTIAISVAPSPINNMNCS